MRIKLFQTSDAEVYLEMLEVTAPTARAFCRKADVAYEAFVGVRQVMRTATASFEGRLDLIRAEVAAVLAGA